MPNEWFVSWVAHSIDSQTNRICCDAVKSVAAAIARRSKSYAYVCIYIFIYIYIYHIICVYRKYSKDYLALGLFVCVYSWLRSPCVEGCSWFRALSPQCPPSGQADDKPYMVVC